MIGHIVNIAAAVVYSSNWKILLENRLRNSDYGEDWAYPHRVINNVTPEQAIRSELAEKCSLVPELEKLGNYITTARPLKDKGKKKEERTINQIVYMAHVEDSQLIQVIKSDYGELFTIPQVRQKLMIFDRRIMTDFNDEYKMIFAWENF